MSSLDNNWQIIYLTHRSILKKIFYFWLIKNLIFLWIRPFFNNFPDIKYWEGIYNNTN
jgi:hypothetical protein